MKKEKASKTYYADFETTQPSENYGVEVYLWCVVSGDYKECGYDIVSFYKWLIERPKCRIYFHNLSFDFSFLQYFLIQNEIPYDILEKNGVIYSVKINNCQICDSLNFLPMTLKEVGENFCNIYKKTSIDYNVYHAHKPSEEEINYCYNDCQVLEEGLTNYLTTLKEVLEENGAKESAKKVFKKLTNSGIAFEGFKELSDFERLCPKTTQANYELFKQAYKGGYVYSNPRGIVKNVQMIDCNSMYPYIYSTIDLPYGLPIPIEEWRTNEFKFYIINIDIRYDLKEGYIPIIGGGVGKFGGTIYKSSSDGVYENLTLCNIDFELIKDFYEIDYTTNWCFGFRTKPNFFKKYCDIFINVKNQNKGVKRAVAKVMLNSPYGKTAMNGLSEIKTYVINENTNAVEGNVIGYKVDDNIYQYLPMAIAITAGARRLLLTTAKKIGFEKVHYMDTDSIKFDSCKVDFEFDGKTLGAWKDEGLCELFKTIAPKKYVYYIDGVLHYTCAGFSKKVLEANMKHNCSATYEEAIQYMTRFDSGLKLNCLQTKKVKGGRALLPVEKEMR